MIYNPRYDEKQRRYVLERDRMVYTRFQRSLDQITQSEAGEEARFMDYLQAKLTEKLENGTAPDTSTIELDEL